MRCLIFGDYMKKGEDKLYDEIQDLDELREVSQLLNFCFQSLFLLFRSPTLHLEGSSRGEICGLRAVHPQGRAAFLVMGS